MQALAFLGLVLIAFNETRIGGWTVSDLVFVAAVFVTFTTLATGRTGGLVPPHARRSSPLILVGSLLMLSASALSSLWAIDPFSSMVVALRLGWVTLVWFWLFRIISPDRAALGFLIKGFKITVLIGSLAGIAGYVGLVQLTEGWANREAGFSGHPNHLAALLGMGLPFFLLDVPKPTNGDHERPFARRLVGVVIVVFGLATTGSMTGMLGAAAGVAVVIVTPHVIKDWRPRRRRSPLTMIALVGAVVMGIILLASTPTFQRFNLLAQGETNTTNSAEARSEYTVFALDRLDERLIIGIGHDRQSGNILWTGDIASDTSDSFGTRVHNIFLKLMLEAGLPALVGLLIILIGATRNSWRLAINTRGTELHPVAVALLASLVATNVVAQFHPTIAQRYYWLPIALIGAAWALRRSELGSLNSPGSTTTRTPKPEPPLTP